MKQNDKALGEALSDRPVRHPSYIPAVITLLLLVWLAPAQAGVQEWIAAFATSNFRFQRGTTNVPFPPIGYLELSRYGDTELEAGDAGVLSFDQTVISQAAGLPVLTGSRDALVLGEWVSWTRFDSNTPSFDSFEVLSLGLPLAWVRQADPDWQVAAFVFPMGHKATFSDSDWSWELMGGGFARYVQSDRLWWGFGLYADVGPGDDLYLPYLGASWSIDDRWTLSAVMPWPALLYAPDRDRLFRLGVMPSGASWTLNPDAGEVVYDLGGWDFGVGASWRLQGNIWGQVRAGYCGLRALRIDDGNLQGPDLDADATPFIGIGIEYRPAILQ